MPDNDVEALDPAALELIATHVLEHYLKHHQVVLKKLEHARTATSQSIQENKAPAQEIQEALPYDMVWEKIIDMFRVGGMSEAELNEIEKILGSVPRAIKIIYDVLVKQDAFLQALITELQSEHYIRAIEYTRQVQKKKNPMTGLTGDYYDSAVNDQRIAEIQNVVIYSKQRRK